VRRVRRNVALIGKRKLIGGCIQAWSLNLGGLLWGHVRRRGGCEATQGGAGIGSFDVSDDVIIGLVCGFEDGGR